MEVRWVLLPDAVPSVDDLTFGLDTFGDSTTRSSSSPTRLAGSAHVLGRRVGRER